LVRHSSVGLKENEEYRNYEKDQGYPEPGFARGCRFGAAFPDVGQRQHKEDERRGGKDNWDWVRHLHCAIPSSRCCRNPGAATLNNGSPGTRIARSNAAAAR
jgi:hypothetical protein